MYNVIYLSVFRLTNIGFAAIFVTDLVLREWNANLKGLNSILSKPKRIYIRVEFTRKSVKRPFCCTVSILQVYFTYFCYITFLALEHHFIENLKLTLKENQIMK